MDAIIVSENKLKDDGLLTREKARFDSFEKALRRLAENR